MNFNEYQEFAARGIHEATLEREPIVGFALGLVGETGEVVDDIKKRVFHGRDIPMEHTKEELGDVLWYIANIATQCGFTLDDIVEANVQKLYNRYPNLYAPGPTITDMLETEYIDGEPVIRQGYYGKEYVVFTRNGPHIAMYKGERGNRKFIKFLNKEEKKTYGIDTVKSDDSVPWD